MSSTEELQKLGCETMNNNKHDRCSVPNYARFLQKLQKRHATGDEVRYYLRRLKVRYTTPWLFPVC